MKYKIYAIIITTLFLISIGAGAISITDNSSKKQPSILDDPVPTWTIGNSWTFKLNNFKVNFQSGNLKINMNGKSDDFTWTVSSTSGTEYIVDITGKLAASYLDIYLPLTSSVLHITGSINPALTKVTGNIVFTKSDLEIKDVKAEIKGIAFAKIDPIPIHLPIPFKVSVDADFSTILPVFDFPLHDHKFWNLPAIDITSKIKAGGILGLFKYPITMKTSYSWIPLAFHCKPKTSVSVQAGTFDAYEITSLLFSIFEYYYAPTVGNIVKIDANMPNGEIHGELVSYNYP
jgi:hypothetical protein